MTVLQRIARIVGPRRRRQTPLERYYSQLVLENIGGAGLPSEREAHQDLRAMHALHLRAPYR